MGSCGEIGTAPGTYRLMDLFCLREVLNQIMKCSCQSELGFAMYQTVEENSSPTFHSVLDIVCRNCQQKVSFGTSVLTGKHEKKQMQSDVDVRLNRFFDLLESGDPRAGFLSLWRELNHCSSSSSPAPLLDTTTSLVIGDQATASSSNNNCYQQPRVVDFVTNCVQDQEIVICYSCHNIFTSAEFAVHETTACVKKEAVVVMSGNHTEYPCAACGKIFTKLFNLKQHTRVHTGERPLQCANCDKTFADRSSMNKHQRTVHELRRPHKCEVCFKGFPSTSHLNDHQATHSKERKFVCPLCSRTFSFRTSLKKHLATHSEEKPFKCKVCLKDFKSRASIKSHMLKVHRLPLNRYNFEAQN